MNNSVFKRTDPDRPSAITVTAEPDSFGSRNGAYRSNLSETLIDVDVDNVNIPEDVKRLKTNLFKCGLSFSKASAEQVEQICYYNNPPLERLSLVHILMYKIYPIESYWNVEKEDDLVNKLLEVSNWFGLVALENKDVVLGKGERHQQVMFWNNLVDAAVIADTWPEHISTKHLVQFTQNLVFSSYELPEEYKSTEPKLGPEAVKTFLANAMTCVTEQSETLVGELSSMQQTLTLDCPENVPNMKKITKQFSGASQSLVQNVKKSSESGLFVQSAKPEESSSEIKDVNVETLASVNMHLSKALNNGIPK